MDILYIHNSEEIDETVEGIKAGGETNGNKIDEENRIDKRKHTYSET